VQSAPDFFRLTKRIHNALHGSDGDGLEIASEDRRLYEEALERFAAEFSALIRPGDVAILHDPQTAGIIPHLARVGASIIWRCHVGTDRRNARTERAWAFLARYLEDADRCIFSRSQFVPGILSDRSVVIRPAIDPLSPKNQPLDAVTARSILVHVGLIEGPNPRGGALFVREDGSPGRVDHCADVHRLGRPPAWDEPLVVQVSRWDRLKDPAGVVTGFQQLVDRTGGEGAHLILAGPNVHAVADDPEGAEVFDGVHGLLLDDPEDCDAFVVALHEVLTKPSLASALGARARERARDEFLSLRALLEFAELIRKLHT
jgi:trehalose synthase